MRFTRSSVGARPDPPAGAPFAYYPVPTEFWGEEQRARPIFVPGERGVQWGRDDKWKLQHVDDGAVRVLIQRQHVDDGVLLMLALRDHNVHPWVIAIGDGTHSFIAHNNQVLTSRDDPPGSLLPVGRPVWVWFRFDFGRVEVGVGDQVGEYTLMRTQTTNQLCGGYTRVGVGKTNSRILDFKLLDVQPLERRADY